MVACGCRLAGFVVKDRLLSGGGESGDGDLGPFCRVIGGDVAADGGGGGGGAGGEATWVVWACVRDTEEGGGAYDGDLGLKKFRMDGCPLALFEGRDMFFRCSQTNTKYHTLLPIVS